MLKSQDVLVALALAAEGPMPFEALARLTGQAVSQSHASVKRLEKSRLVNADRSVNRPNLAEFLIHGVRYLLPPVSLGVLTGMPTAGAAPSLQSMSFPMPDAAPWVWPDDDGTVRGVGLAPICASAPGAARNHETPRCVPVRSGVQSFMRIILGQFITQSESLRAHLCEYRHYVQ